MSLDVTTLALAKSYTDQHSGGGGGSVPKPLTYDYMPEGYPTKAMGTVTLMEEQEVAFSDGGGIYIATSPVQFEVSDGDKLTVVWDGVSYDTIVTMVRGQYPTFGNLGLLEAGETTDCPFAYFDQRNGSPMWATADTATSHTIKVTTIDTIYQTIDVNMLPKAGENYGVVKKDEIVTAYVFPNAQAPQLQMNKAVDDFVAGKAKIKWGKDNVLEAYRSSDTKIIMRLSGDPVNAYEYTANEDGHSYSKIVPSGVNLSEIKIWRIYLKNYDNPLGGTLLGPIVGVYNDSNDRYIKYGTTRIYEDGIAIKSSGSSKMFKITVDDSGTLTATEVTG